MSESKLPSDVDKEVGKCIRRRRRELKLTQERLGEMLGLTFQQVQKYEKGVNRVSAGRLFEVASVLEVPVGYFFNSFEPLPVIQRAQLAEDSRDSFAPVLSNEVLQLIEAFQRIEDAGLRRSLLATVRAAAEATGERADD